MMKTKHNIILFTLLGLWMIFIGCVKEKEISDANNYIRIFSVIERPDLRVNGNNFEQGDQIGVFIVPYTADNSTPGKLGESDYANNIPHIYQNGNWQTGQGELLPWPGARNIDVYAYYPYDDNASINPENYDFFISADQTRLDGYNASDFLHARILGLPPSSTVPLQFSHSLSKININLKSGIALIKESFEQTQVYLQDILPGCNINLATGIATLIAAAPAEEIIPLKLTDPVTTYDLSLTAIIPPQTISAGTRLLRINNQGINYIYTTEEDITFRQGYTTTFNIEINQQGIVVTTSTINEWNDGGTITGNIGLPLPRILDLNTIDWDQSYVHYVYDNSVLIGQVCCEYLSRNTSPILDIPAIVVYPLGTDGKMDLTKGYVARVYNRTRNSSYEYVFNTGNVHGGSAVFDDSNNNLSLYTQGSLSLVNKVLIESADKISAATDNAIPKLTTRPYLLTDIDNNTYPVTKIGTQYWIQKNYKAEHYSNGEPLEYYYYNDNPAMYKELLGAYYTWATITDPAGIAPEGWRIPTRTDWNSLYQYVNPETGRKIKIPGMWNTIAYADNVTGFAALPAGRRTNTGVYNELNTYGQWWSSTSNTTSNAWRIYVGDGYAITEADLNKTYTQSVRLLRDN